MFKARLFCSSQLPIHFSRVNGALCTLGMHRVFLVVLSTSIALEWELHQVDAKGAFLHAILLETDEI